MGGPAPPAESQMLPFRLVRPLPVRQVGIGSEEELMEIRNAVAVRVAAGIVGDGRHPRTGRPAPVVGGKRDSSRRSEMRFGLEEQRVAVAQPVALEEGAVRLEKMRFAIDESPCVSGPGSVVRTIDVEGETAVLAQLAETDRSARPVLETADVILPHR